MGAIGSAIIAMEERTWEKSRFKGFDLRHKRYELTSFVCKDCSNICEIRQVNIEGENPLYYGSRCGKFDDERSLKKESTCPGFSGKERMRYLILIRKTNLIIPSGKRLGYHRYLPSTTFILCGRHFSSNWALML